MARKTCIENYIILRDGCYRDENGNAIPTPEPISGYYVEDLPGLSVENIAAIAPEKLFSATNVVTEKLYFAADWVEKRLKAALNASGIQLNNFGSIQKACSVTDTVAMPYAGDRGLRVSKSYLNSPQSAIWLEAITIKATATGASTLKVKDLSGTVLWSLSITTLQDTEQTFKVREYFREDTILVTIDTTLVGVYEYQCNEESSCKPCSAKKEYLSIQGWNGAGVSTVGFLSVCVRLDCTDYDIICQYLDRLGMAVLYQLGVLILEEWISPNNRLNIIKIHSEEWALAKMKDWDEYSKRCLDYELDNIIQIMSTDKHCYNCRGRARAIPLLP